MCLNSLKDFDCPNEGIGYKIFNDGKESGIRSPYWCNGPYELGKEYEAKLSTDQSGFYIFPSLEDAIKYMGDEFATRVYKVSYRDICNRGIQNGKHCILTRYMTLMEVAYQSEHYDPYEADFEEDDDFDDWDDEYYDFDDEEDDWDDEDDLDEGW